MSREKHLDSIGGYAQGMNISQEGLRHYERKGVIHPMRDPESGYRYYSLKDTIAIAFCRKCRSYGFGLDDSVYLLHEADMSSRAKLAEEQMASMEDQIRRQTRLLEHLKKRSAEIASVREMVGKYSIRSMPPLCVIFTRFNQETIKSREAVKLMQSWNKCQPYPDIITMASPEYLMSRKGGLSTGLGASPELVEALNLTFTQTVSAAECLYTARIVEWEEFNSGAYLEPVARHMEACHMVPGGDAVTRIVFVTMPSGQDCSLLCEIWAPLAADV